MIKQIAVVTVTEVSLHAWLSQVSEFFGSEATVVGYVLERRPAEIEGDIILYRTRSSYMEIKNLCQNPQATLIYLGATFSNEQIQKIYAIPPNERVLVVGSRSYLTNDSIKQLKSILPYTLYFVPYNNSVDNHMDLSIFHYAITFFESDSVDVPHVICIGMRKIHWRVYEQMIKEQFDGNRELLQKLAEYCATLVPMDYSVSEISSIHSVLENSIEQIIDLFDYPAFVLDGHNTIWMYNEKLCALFQCYQELYQGYHVSDTPYFDEIFNHMEQAGEKVCIQFFHQKLKTQLTSWKRIVKFDGQQYYKVIFVDLLKPQEERKNKGYNTGKFSFDDIVYCSDAMKKCIEIAKKISSSDQAVLIMGESGTGKELLASAIHKKSARRTKPLMSVNCAAFSESLLESELFGYEAGAFTGALKEGKKGIFELANGGTIFLDEIGDAPAGLQATLLRVLQEKEVRRIGGRDVIPVDVRIISATNRDLKAAVAIGLFRKDLYYRLNAFTLYVPPLRDRIDDLEPLALEFMARTGYAYKTLAPEIISTLKKFPWDGNVRELQNCIGYSAFMSGEIVSLNDLPKEYQSGMLANTSIKNDDAFENIPFIERTLYHNILETLALRSVGRPTLLIILQKKNIGLTEGQLKKALLFLKKGDYIVQKTGRSGALITQKGIALLEKLDETG